MQKYASIQYHPTGVDTPTTRDVA